MYYFIAGVAMLVVVYFLTRRGKKSEVMSSSMPHVEQNMPMASEDVNLPTGQAGLPAQSQNQPPEMPQQ